MMDDICRTASHILALCVLLVVTAGCESESDPEPVEHDLTEVLERDTLVALTTFNSTSYFLHRGRPLGYEYELLQAFADEHDIELKMEVIRSRDSLVHYLNEGMGDVLAARVVPTATDSDRVAFTRTLYRTQPTLVQQAEPADSVDRPVVDTLLEDNSSASNQQPDSMTIQARLVSNPSELAGERVHVPDISAYEERLVELSDSISGDIQVVDVQSDVSVERLIRRVANGEIELTVSHENLARLREGYYTNITVQPTLGPTHEVSWAVRENATDLQNALNRWIESEENSALFDNLYEKYFVDRRGYNQRLDDEYLTSETGKLSPYDSLLVQYADSVEWDWRLLASQTYQESQFKPQAQSWAGASGLLQLMPATASEFGVQDVYDPHDNVRGAARFINWLRDYWRDEIDDPEERRKFVLASYNTGHGHVEDARRLTEKNGGNVDRWEDVAYWLLQKSKRPVYTDPVVKYGFCRGLEPVTYVSRILNRFDHYREFVTRDQAPAS